MAYDRSNVIVRTGKLVIVAAVLGGLLIAVLVVRSGSSSTPAPSPAATTTQSPPARTAPPSPTPPARRDVGGEAPAGAGLPPLPPPPPPPTEAEAARQPDDVPVDEAPAVAPEAAAAPAAESGPRTIFVVSAASGVSDAELDAAIARHHLTVLRRSGGLIRVKAPDGADLAQLRDALAQDPALVVE